ITIGTLIPYSMLQDKAAPNTIYLATNLGIYRSLDRGNSWAQLAAPAAPKKTVRRAASRRRAPTRRGKTTARKAAPVKSAPAETTAAVQEGKKLVPALVDKVNLLTYTEDGKNGIFAGTVKGLYRSYDPAKGWEKISFGAGIDEQVYAVAASAQNPNTIFVGTAISGLIVSNDNGETWRKVPVIADNIPISSIAIDPQDSKTIYLGTIQTLYISRDGGNTWTRRGGNLPLGNYNSILINPRNTREVFVGSALESNGGIYQSTNAGESWKRIDGKNEKMGSRRIWTMKFDPNDTNRIFAGTHSSGIYRIERSPVVTASETITRERVSTAGN
ncbi:MAG: YCF48-related protein, partial [Pyrinomonadaceae bacterium]